jgi:hypothetical protein
MVHLLVGRVDDNEVLDRVFLVNVMRRHLTDREHAVLALRFSGYTRTAIVRLLGIGKTTVYTSERQAMKTLQKLYRLEEEDEWENTDTGASYVGDQSHISSPSAQNARGSTGEQAASGPGG